MDFFTAVLRQSEGFWVENGVVGQGDTQEQAVAKLKKAVESLEEAYGEDLIYIHLYLSQFKNCTNFYRRLG